MDFPRSLPRLPSLLQQDGLFHPSPKTFSLVAWKLSGIDSLRQEGFSEEVINTIQNFIRPSTKRQYGRLWHTFSSWCSQRKIDPLSAPVKDVLAFFQYLVCIVSLQGSNLSFPPGNYFSNGRSLGHNVAISRFLTGVFNLNPPIKCLLPTWDLNSASSRNFSEYLTLKCVFLVAITSAKRRSELQALGRDPGYLRKEKGGFRLRTIQGFLSKTAVPGHLGRDIFLPSFPENKKLRVKRVLRHYLVAKDDMPGNEGRLILAFGGTDRGKPVSKKEGLIFVDSEESL
jgi:hypothetical protein